MQLKYSFAVALVLAASACARAQGAVQSPSGVLTLNTTASVEVTQDVLAVAFSVSRDGGDAQSVQNGVKQALDAALAEARKVAKPGQVDVQTGNFSLYPRYSNPPKGGPSVISGWQGSAELLVQGKDEATIAQLSGRIATMSIARVGYTLSREAREKVEADVTSQAIAAWRGKAAHVTQQFGYNGYVVIEVNVSTGEASRPMAPDRLALVRAKSAADLPTEAGKGEVVATVNGSVQMTK